MNFTLAKSGLIVQGKVICVNSVKLFDMELTPLLMLHEEVN